MTDINFNFRRGGGAEPEILYGTVEIKPTLAHARGTALVLPAPTKIDLVDGKATAVNVSPTPAPVDGEIAWAQRVKVTDRHGHTWEWMVGVPDSTTAVEFTSLPRYFETKPPAFGQGPQGIPGEAATVAVGTVAEGGEASVTNSGTGSNAVLDFVLPEGPQGLPGNGVPVGGSALQTIQKNASNTDTVWVDVNKALVGLGNVDNTSDANKPVSSAQKTYIDQSNTLGYREKLFADLPNSYPQTTTAGLYALADGWPNPSAENASFVQVTTFRNRGYTGGVLQLISAYSDPEAPILYRISNSNNTWGPVQTLPNNKSRILNGELNVRLFGAKGDGVTDDTVAINACTSAAALLGYSKVVFPTGKYLVSSSIETFSGQTLSGYGAEIVGQASPLIKVAGSGLGTAVNLVSQNKNRGDNQLRLAKNDFAVGDLIMLVSQRVSTSLDTPATDRLGSETGDGTADNGPYFGEFFKVAAKDTTNSTYDVITMSSTLNFNGYRIDKTQDPSSDRPNAMAYKVNAIKDVIVEGFRLNGIAGTSVSVVFGDNVLVRDVTDIKNHNYGVTLLFGNSYNSRAQNVNSAFTYPMPAGGLIYQRNVFKVIGSQDITWEGCESVMASQAFDVTYNRANYLITSVNVKLDRCKTYGATTNAVTTHPGTSDVSIHRCDFSNGSAVLDASGIGIRSPRVSITNTRIVGNPRGNTAGNLGNYGISFFDGPCRGFKVDNNYIEGFDRGVFLGDGSSAEKRNTSSDSSVTDNQIIDCYIGMATSRVTSSTEDPWWGVLFDSNTVKSKLSGAIGFWTDVANGGSQGYTLSNNQLHFTSNTAVGFNISPTTISASILNNKMSAPLGSRIFALSGGADTTSVNMLLNIQGNTHPESGYIEIPVFAVQNNLTLQGNDISFCFPLTKPYSLDMYKGEYSLPAPTGTSAAVANGFPSTGGGAGIIESSKGTGVVNSHRYWPLNSSGVSQYRYCGPSNTWVAWKTT